MAQGGWAVLDDRNELTQEGIPAPVLAPLQAAVNDVRKAGGTLRSLAFAPDGGWVLLFGKDFKEHGLPKELSRTLAEHRRKGVGLRCVTFDSAGDWFLLDDSNACFSNNANHPAYKKLQELRTKGETLQWITFTPGLYTHGYTLEHNPVRRIRAVMTFDFASPDGGVDTWAVLPAQAPQLPRQRGVKVSLEPSSVTVPDTGLLKQAVMLSRVSGKPKGFEEKVTYELTLYTNRLIPRLAGQTPRKVDLPADLVKVYTAATDDQTAQVFQEFLDKAKLRRGQNESDLAFARRILSTSHNTSRMCIRARTRSMSCKPAKAIAVGCRGCLSALCAERRAGPAATRSLGRFGGAREGGTTV